MKGLRYLFYLGILFTVVFSGCSTSSNDQSLDQAQITSSSFTLTPTLTFTPTFINTATSPSPTSTPLPVRQSAAREQIRQILLEYGQVDDKYLTDNYWQNLDNNIDNFGKANCILVLEYHGDSYSMYDGFYAMTPESFARDMHYLMSNKYHFVTGAEMSAFISGSLDLPNRSIFLTTDSGSGSDQSMGRIISLFQDLETLYGYTPHMNSYIWTMNMNSDESTQCKQDECWDIFRHVRDSGYFTIGTHTESHADFSSLTKRQTVYDLSQSLEDIQINLNLHVYAIAWPFEACSSYPDTLTDLGIKYAFGGSTRDPLKLYTYKNDDMPLCLPRVFPPNPDGFSGRPRGLTLEQMLEQARIDHPLK